MSKSTVAHDANFVSAIESGIEVYKIRWEVFWKVPELARVIQSALNATAQVMGREDWMQMMFKV